MSCHQFGFHTLASPGIAYCVTSNIYTGEDQCQAVVTDERAKRSADRCVLDSYKLGRRSIKVCGGFPFYHSDSWRVFRRRESVIGRKEWNVLFNDAINTLYYGYMASDIW